MSSDDEQPPPPPDAAASPADASGEPPVVDAPSLAPPAADTPGPGGNDTEDHPAPARQDVSDYGVDFGVDYGLDPNSIAADRLRKLIVAGILSAVSLPFVVGIALAWVPFRWLLPLLWAVFVMALAARAWWWPPVSYRHISYRVDAKKLEIRRGVWWRSVALVPRSRVQHTDVSQGPIERNFGLGTLIVHTAGTQFAAVPLSGLAYGTAMEIRDLLIDESDADDAV